MAERSEAGGRAAAEGPTPPRLQKPSAALPQFSRQPPPMSSRRLRGKSLVQTARGGLGERDGYHGGGLCAQDARADGNGDETGLACGAYLSMGETALGADQQRDLARAAGKRGAACDN